MIDYLACFHANICDSVPRTQQAVPLPPPRHQPGQIPPGILVRLRRDSPHRLAHLLAQNKVRLLQRHRSLIRHPAHHLLPGHPTAQISKKLVGGQTSRKLFYGRLCRQRVNQYFRINFCILS